MSTPKDENKKELRIGHVSGQLHKDILTIAGNLSIPAGNWVKMKLKEAVDSTPAHLKLKRD